MHKLGLKRAPEEAAAGRVRAFRAPVAGQRKNAVLCTYFCFSSLLGKTNRKNKYSLCCAVLLYIKTTFIWGGAVAILVFNDPFIKSAPMRECCMHAGPAGRCWHTATTMR